MYIGSAMKKPKTKKRILIDVRPEDHWQVKKMAVGRGITMRLWILRAIAEQLRKEREVGNLEEENK